MMENVLYYKELFDPIDSKGVKAITETNDDRKKLNKKAGKYITQWVYQS
jgi:hypothetical protein